MSYLFTLSPGTFRWSDHLIAHILAISMPEPRVAPLLLCSHGELLCAYKGPERVWAVITGGDGDGKIYHPYLEI